MLKRVLICFPKDGGVKQFTDELIRRLINRCEYLVIGPGKVKKLKVFKYLFFDEIIFSNNNLMIYMMLPFFRGKVTLLLHDHKLRTGSNLNEKLSILLFYIFKSRFNKVIIHTDTDEKARKLLIRDNVTYKRMPPHGLPQVGQGLVEEKYRSYFLCFGRVENYKNFEYFAELVSMLSDQTLLIAGSGSISDKLSKLERDNDNVKILNRYILDEEVDFLFRGCKYLVLPYKDITQTGLCDLAGYYKKPLIVSNIDAFNDIVDYGGAIRIPNDRIVDACDILTKSLDNDESIYSKMAMKSHDIYLRNKGFWSSYIGEIE